jgi:trehalose 6-phosphate phosphatase
MPETLTKTTLADRDVADPSTPPSDGKQSSLPAEMLKFDLNRTAILLDVDGTLLDIAPTPLEVHVPPQLRDALYALRQQLDGAIAFISGRPVAELDRIFDPLRLSAVGGHGAEIRFLPKGEIRRSRIAMLDEEIRADFAQIGKIGKGIIVEDKGYSLAIHYRQAPEYGGEIMKNVAAICKNERCDSLEVLPGKLVIEIKPGGYDKGTGLREMMATEIFKGRRPIFIGDDVTDNAAFAALQEFDGTGFSVGGIVKGATFNFDGPQDVRAWLQRLAGVDDRKV